MSGIKKDRHIDTKPLPTATLKALIKRVLLLLLLNDVVFIRFCLAFVRAASPARNFGFPATFAFYAHDYFLLWGLINFIIVQHLI